MRLRLGAPILVTSRLSVHLRVHPLPHTLPHGLHVLPANHRPQAPCELATQPPSPPRDQGRRRRRFLTRSRLFPTRLFACWRRQRRRLKHQHRAPRRPTPLRASANRRTEIASAEHTFPARSRCQLFQPQQQQHLETHIHITRPAAESPSSAADPEPLACGIHTRAAFVQRCEQPFEGVRGVRCPCSFGFGIC